MRLVVTIDPDDLVPRYEEKRFVVTHDMCLGEATEDNSLNESEEGVVIDHGDDDSEEEPQLVLTAEDAAFIVNDVEPVDSDYTPSSDDDEEDAVDDALVTAELLEDSNP